ncbi:MAG TPA: hypothetical protein VGQ75_05585 [Thermoanaerobaculia bacterium]|nr:hypothetical protein [Thermoanaerobaculia bacterium]
MAPECGRIDIPPHRHKIELSLFRTEISVGYGWNEKLLLAMRLPYEIKDQHVSYRTLDGQPFTPPYGDIHHRTETLRGFGDGEVGVSFSLAKDWLAGAGVTIPLGRTEPDPIELGRRGLKHEHIQFGSGTFDPKLSLQWSRPLGGIRIAASVDARIPLYENEHGFKAPATVRWAAGPTVAIGSTGIAAQYAGQYQSIGKWNGEVDEGTGFHNGGVFLRGTFLVAKGFRATPGIYREVYSHSLSDESFRQGTTYSIVLTRFFQK